MDGIAEPYAVAAAGRAYVRSASISEDSVVAVDLETGSVLAEREIGTGAGGLAVNRSGELLYVARSAGAGADIAVIDIEAATSAASWSTRLEATVDAVRVARQATGSTPRWCTDPGAPSWWSTPAKGRVLDTIFVRLPRSARHRCSSRRPAGFRHRLGRRTRQGDEVVDTGASRVVKTVPTGRLPAQLVWSPPARST